MYVTLALAAVLVAPLTQRAPKPDGFILDPATVRSPGAGPGPVNVGNNLRMNRDPLGALQVEPFIAINPLDHNRLVGTAVDTRLGNGRAAFYTSTDGGRTTVVDGAFPLQPGFTGGGDPSVGFDGQGRAFIVELQLTSTGSGALFVYRSDDGGLTWPFTRQVFRAPGNGPDKPFLAVDRRTTGQFAGSLYVTFTGFHAPPFDLQLLRSRDGGATWSGPVFLGLGQGTSPAVGPNGEVFVAWEYGGAIVCASSLDGGASVRTVRIVASIVQNPNPLPPTNFRCFSFPSTAVDIGVSPYRGRVYVSWSSRAGASSEVFCVWSTDNGITWSAPVRVNDVVTGDQFFQALAVDEAGTVFASWQDRRNDPANRSYDIYASASYDGGVTWLPNWKVSSAPSDPGTSGWIGDYTGLCAGGGRCYPIWTDLRHGDYDVYTAPVQADLEVNPPLFFSAFQGGTIDLPVKAGPRHAGQSYVLIAGLSGTDPGVVLGNGLTLHLNPDSLTLLSLSAPNQAPFVNTAGFTTAGGIPPAQPRFVVPPGLLLPLVFQPLSFAYVMLDATPRLTYASNPVTVRILP